MPLTPEDVRNKLFTTTKRMRHGYDEDEVDGFLDEVEAELARLLKENAELRAKVASHTGPAPAPAPMAPAAPVAAVAAPAAAMSADEASGSALRVLAAAQKTADETVAEAKRSAEKLMGDAHTRREAADKELAERHKSVMGTLEADRDKLERQVENLRTFEREYRARLKVYLEGQLRDLEGRGGEVVRLSSCRRCAGGAVRGRDHRASCRAGCRSAVAGHDGPWQRLRPRRGLLARGQCADRTAA